MDAKSLTRVIMGHEKRLSKTEQKTDNLEKLFTRHANQHFQVRILLVTNTVVLIGIVIGVIIALT